MTRKPTYEELEQRIKEFEKVEAERKWMEEALREDEERFRLAFENANDGVCLVNKDGNLLRVNKRMCDIFGYSKKELESMTVNDIAHPEDKDISPKFIKKSISGEVESTVFEKRYIYKQGHIIWCQVSSSIIKDAKGDPLYFISHVQDITQRKQTEKALWESESRYSALFTGITDAVYVHHITEDGFPGQIIDVNYVACEMLGYTRDELIGMGIGDIDALESTVDVHRAVEDLKAGRDVLFEQVHVAKDGRRIPVEVHAQTFEYKGCLAILSTVRDITDRKLAEKEKKKLETQLQQAQKMEAIGTLAGGIAHDFNNLLMGIQGRTSLMISETDSSHPHNEHLKGIEDYVKNAAELTNQLLAFARGGKYEVRPTDLNKLVKSQNRMLGRTRKEITIHGKYEANLWSTEVDKGQIEQVLLNLYVNAWQSMPGGGNLYIQTENVTLDENYLKPFAMNPGKYVKISVVDTGVGMDEATRERIFDPFFTTKEMGRGTGLGLASAYGIVKNHGGFIDVYSEQGKGSAFNLYLPASGKKVIEEEKLAEDVLKGAETVLLVDDEEMIIDVGKPILGKLGYNTLIARNGKDAIEIYKEKKDQIDIVILDMIMPEMGGGDTYDRLRKINPEIKVLLSSGYSVDGQATEILERGCNGFIQKPFSMKDLSQKIRGILDKK